MSGMVPSDMPAAASDAAAGTPAPGTGRGESRTESRSPGLQARSRERRDDILREAAVLVEAKGYDGLKMRELARRCDMPIASLYHYFPSSAAVLRALAEAHLDAVNGALMGLVDQSGLAGARGPAAVAAAGQIVRGMARQLREAPASAAIWEAMRAVPDLRQIDVEDTAEVARDLVPYLRPICPRVPEARLGDFAQVLVEAVQANLLMQIDAPPDRQEALTEALVLMVGFILEAQVRAG